MPPSKLEKALRRLVAWSSARGETTEQRLAALLQLTSETSSAAEPLDVPSAEAAVRKCVERTGKARTYCARVVEQDSSREDIKKRDYVWLEYRLDFVGPDMYHVRQLVWPRDAGDGFFDEWITIGDEHYTCPMVWLRADELRSRRPHRDLLVERYLKILQNTPHTSSAVREYRAEVYRVLHYGFDTPPSGFYEDDGAGSGTIRLSVWINVTTNLLAKVVIETDGITRQQVFTSYGQKVRVVRPPVGMERSADDPELCIITDNRRPAVRFHE